MRVLLGCVNSAVSLVGYDVEQRQAFWYCPGNVLRVCGVCRHEGALYVASDSMLQRLDADGLEAVRLPGPHENLAHSVKPLGGSLLGIADTGNSRILLHSGGPASLALSPLEGWGDALPLDAIHLNDFVPWRDGVLASAFNHQPFDRWKRSSLAWKKEGWGVIYAMRRHQGHTLTRIVASGLNCPHSLYLHGGDVYCCSSASGEFFRYREEEHGLLHVQKPIDGRVVLHPLHQAAALPVAHGALHLLAGQAKRAGGIIQQITLLRHASMRAHQAVEIDLDVAFGRGGHVFAEKGVGHRRGVPQQAAALGFKGWHAAFRLLSQG